MNEHDDEPIRGLPGYLPQGEAIVWQGAPDWRVLALTAFRTPWVAGYFALLALWSVMGSGSRSGLMFTLGFAATALILLVVLAWASARTTVYTLTTRRIVLRIGIAVPTCVNLPLRLVGAVDLAAHARGTGDIALAVSAPMRLGVLALWPHARPFHFARPQPTLRAVPGAADIARLIAAHCVAVQGAGAIAPHPAADAPSRPREAALAGALAS